MDGGVQIALPTDLLDDGESTNNYALEASAGAGAAMSTLPTPTVSAASPATRMRGNALVFICCLPWAYCIASS